MQEGKCYLELDSNQKAKASRCILKKEERNTSISKNNNNNKNTTLGDNLVNLEFQGGRKSLETKTIVSYRLPEKSETKRQYKEIPKGNAVGKTRPGLQQAGSEHLKHDNPQLRARSQHRVLRRCPKTRATARTLDSPQREWDELKEQISRADGNARTT